MKTFQWDMLQLFADGGGSDGGSSASASGTEGGAGPESGENAADAGRQRLRELGVPESKIRKNRAYKFGNTPADAVRKASQQEQPNKEAAAPPEQKDSQQEALNPNSRMSWDEILKDPEYNQEIQKLVKARLKERGASRDAMEAMRPALELAAKSYGLDSENIDYAELSKRMTDDNRYYEDKAIEMGISADVVKKMDQQASELQMLRKKEAQNLEEQRAYNHLAGLHRQGEAMREKFPWFDLRKELENPIFVRLTAPDSGLSVEDAYYAVHRKELQSVQAQVVASQVAKQMANSIRSNSARPVESGVQQATSTVTFDYSKASREQREALKRRIRSGERVIPGHEFN